VQSLDDPLCEILPPRGKDHLEGFLVTVEIGHVAHRRSSGVRSERSAEKLQLVINTWRKKLKLKSSAASSPG
jgi:hypothetical protein